MLKENLTEIFLDTDVAFDIIAKREPHFEYAQSIVEEVVRGNVNLYISECSVSNLIYLAFDIYKIQDAAKRLLTFLEFATPLNSGKKVMITALNSSFTDKEDALQYYTALKHNMDCVITRNIKDYAHSLDLLPVMSPADYFNL